MNINEWLLSHGFTVPNVALDGKIQRFGRNGKPDNCWFIGFQNHSSRGGDVYSAAIVGDWATGEQYQYKPSRIATADRAAYNHAIKVAQDRVDELMRQEKTTGADNAKKIFGSAKAEGTTPYLAYKKISNLFGARIAGHDIAVPMRTVDGDIVGLQLIADKTDGSRSKNFIKGSTVKGSMFVFGRALDDETREVYVCEGWATAATVYMALGIPVVCTFTAGNLKPVAMAVRSRWPQVKLVIAGDDDHGKETNPGRTAAEQAAVAALCGAVFPVFEEPVGKTDWNDLYLAEGLEAVTRQLMVRPKSTGFYPLGYDGGSYFFFSDEARDIIKLNAFASTNMYQLAPKKYWEDNFPGGKGGNSFCVGSAADHLISSCRARGLFDGDRVRGTGVWLDAGRVVVNTGDDVSVDGRCRDFTTRYLYVRSVHVIPPLVSPMSAADGGKLVKACAAFSWVDPQSAILLAGWIMIARVASALPVRPHVWLTGGKAAGKSTVMERIIAPVLTRPGRLYLQGGSTEAGIRQIMRSSSLALIFDEFESNSKSSKERHEAIIELMRNTWSQTQGEVAKGSAIGSATRYQLAFAALLSSIRVTLDNDADRSRFSILELAPHRDSPDDWKSILEALEPLTEEYGVKLFSRAVAMVPTIIETQTVIGQELARTMGQRYGQQVGSLLAGWWCLTHDQAPTAEEARIIAASINREKSDDNEKSDEQDCLHHLLTTRISLNSDEGNRIEMTVGEALALERWHKPLVGYGMRVKDNTHLMVSDNHAELQKIYRGSRWVKWARSLRRLPGATSGSVTSFGRGVKSRYTLIAIDYEQ